MAHRGNLYGATGVAYQDKNPYSQPYQPFVSRRSSYPDVSANDSLGISVALTEDEDLEMHHGVSGRHDQYDYQSAQRRNSIQAHDHQYPTQAHALRNPYGTGAHASALYSTGETDQSANESMLGYTDDSTYAGGVPSRYTGYSAKLEREYGNGSGRPAVADLVAHSRNIRGGGRGHANAYGDDDEDDAEIEIEHDDEALNRDDSELADLYAAYEEDEANDEVNVDLPARGASKAKHTSTSKKSNGDLGSINSDDPRYYLGSETDQSVPDQNDVELNESIFVQTPQKGKFSETGFVSQTHSAGRGSSTFRSTASSTTTLPPSSSSKPQSSVAGSRANAVPTAKPTTQRARAGSPTDTDEFEFEVEGESLIGSPREHAEVKPSTQKTGAASTTHLADQDSFDIEVEPSLTEDRTYEVRAPTVTRQTVINGKPVSSTKQSTQKSSKQPVAPIYEDRRQAPEDDDDEIVIELGDETIPDVETKIKPSAAPAAGQTSVAQGASGIAPGELRVAPGELRVAPKVAQPASTHTNTDGDEDHDFEESIAPGGGLGGVSYSRIYSDTFEESVAVPASSAPAPAPAATKAIKPQAPLQTSAQTRPQTQPTISTQDATQFDQSDTLYEDSFADISYAAPESQPPHGRSAATATSDADSSADSSALSRRTETLMNTLANSGTRHSTTKTTAPPKPGHAWATPLEQDEAQSKPATQSTQTPKGSTPPATKRKVETREVGCQTDPVYVVPLPGWPSSPASTMGFYPPEVNPGVMSSYPPLPAAYLTPYHETPNTDKPKLGGADELMNPQSMYLARYMQQAQGLAVMPMGFSYPAFMPPVRFVPMPMTMPMSMGVPEAIPNPHMMPMPGYGLAAPQVVPGLNIGLDLQKPFSRSPMQPSDSFQAQLNSIMARLQACKASLEAEGLSSNLNVPTQSPSKLSASMPRTDGSGSAVAATGTTNGGD